MAIPLADATDRVYRGVIGNGLAVVARVRRRGDALEGKYFYESKRRDIALDGTVSTDGRLVLEERDAKRRKTGTLEGTFDADGTIVGTWSDAAHRLPFRWVPIIPGVLGAGPLPLYEKEVHVTQRPKTPVSDEGVLKACEFDAYYPELNGALEPALEAKVNALLRPMDAEQEPCDVPSTFKQTYKVSFNRGGILSVVFDQYSCCGAHPVFSKDFVNVAVRTGERIPLVRLVRPTSRPELFVRLRPIVRKELGDEFEDDIGKVAEQMTNDDADFSIEEKGLRFSAFNRQPHVIQGAFQKGFFVEYTKLRGILVAGLLPP